jgi:glyoxylase-like metal-dependent hydrolase (beta-lactamase superfamily II)
VQSVRLGQSEVLQFSANRWKQNCFVLIGDGSAACVVVDPGYDGEAIVEAIAARGLRVAAILATHAHHDHIASAALVQSRFRDPPFYCHPDDEMTLRTAHSYAMLLEAEAFAPPRAQQKLSDGDRLDLAGQEFNVHHAPGHSPGGCVFDVRGALFTGDLFIKEKKEVRRPGSNPEELHASRKRVFDEFPSKTVVFPGHGRPTTLGELERRFFSEVRAIAT